MRVSSEYLQYMVGTQRFFCCFLCFLTCLFLRNSWYYNRLPDGNVDFTKAHAIASAVTGGTQGGLTDVKTGPDGYLYFADYSGTRNYCRMLGNYCKMVLREGKRF